MKNLAFEQQTDFEQADACLSQLTERTQKVIQAASEASVAFNSAVDLEQDAQPYWLKPLEQAEGLIREMVLEACANGLKVGKDRRHVRSSKAAQTKRTRFQQLGKEVANRRITTQP